MGKSQETFGKKEREKKKQKKKEAKARRREARKAEPGKSTDSFLYQDVYGNFHETKPEPAEKVKAKNINLGVPDRQEEADEDPIRKGVVTFFNSSKGYGFIKDKKSQQSIFVHVNNITEEIVEDNMVSFEIQQGPKGPSAHNVKVIR